MRWAIRPGAYQIGSGHGRRYHGGPVEPYCPTVIMLPGRKEMIGFPDVRQAAVVLRALRADWPNTDWDGPDALSRALATSPGS